MEEIHRVGHGWTSPAQLDITPQAGGPGDPWMNDEGEPAFPLKCLGAIIPAAGQRRTWSHPICLYTLAEGILASPLV